MVERSPFDQARAAEHLPQSSVGPTAASSHVGGRTPRDLREEFEVDHGTGDDYSPNLQALSVPVQKSKDLLLQVFLWS